MDLRHARTFVTVAELGSVSKAALRLHIAQPALSRQIGNPGSMRAGISSARISSRSSVSSCSIAWDAVLC